MLSGKARVPVKSEAGLAAMLARVAADLKVITGNTPAFGTTPVSGTLPAAPRAWAEYRDRHPLISGWLDAEECVTLLQYAGELEGDVVYPAYEVMVRTGRTSCARPNIQHAPHAGGIRDALVASPGHLLLVVDYATAELRALAAHCLYRFGRSALADVIRAGIDPHAHTAALVLGASLTNFMGWKADPIRRETFAAARQAAKAINFGVPGGLGPAALRDHARAAYGVEMTEDEARRWRDLLVTTVYPELGLYLAGDDLTAVGRNLRAPAEAVRAELDEIPFPTIEKVLCGTSVRADGTPFPRPLVSRVWSSVTGLNHNPALTDELAARRPGRVLAAAVCGTGVATVTGRVRGRVNYTQSRNTPFQGLAADGAGLALFELVRAGFRVVAFVHDEVLVALPDHGGFVPAASVDRGGRDHARGDGVGARRRPGRVRVPPRQELGRGRAAGHLRRQSLSGRRRRRVTAPVRWRGHGAWYRAGNRLLVGGGNPVGFPAFRGSKMKSDKIERLRQAAAEDAERIRETARDAGESWACDRADPAELKRLESAQVAGQPLDTPEAVLAVLRPDDAGLEPEDADAFFGGLPGVDEGEHRDPDFPRAFVNAALDVWRAAQGPGCPPRRGRGGPPRPSRPCTATQTGDPAGSPRRPGPPASVRGSCSPAGGSPRSRSSSSVMSVLRRRTDALSCPARLWRRDRVQRVTCYRTGVVRATYRRPDQPHAKARMIC